MIKIYKEDGTIQEIKDSISPIVGLSCNITGENNLVELHMPLKLNNVNIKILGHNNYVSIGASMYQLNHIMINMGFDANDRSVKIGSQLFCGGLNIVCSDNANSVQIGDDCLFSDNISIRTEDGHTIYDVTTGKVLNKARTGVIIGNHVWVARNVYIGKNVSIADNSIIGYGSVCVKSLMEKNCSYAGIPAKKIKSNVNWSRDRATNYIARMNKKEKRIVAVIPARYASSRFPGKPLALISGKPMVQYVYERVSKVSAITDVIVATDDQRIYDKVVEFGGKAVMTGDCSCGSERVFEAIKNVDCDIVINVQGDEPLIKPEMIELLISAFKDSSVEMATLKKRIEGSKNISDSNIAKVITDINNDAIMFSRSIIPYNRDNKEKVVYYKHIGLYGYTKSFLGLIVRLPQSSIEKAEQLEQMRVIENGYKIKVLETTLDSIGVDLPEHIQKIEEALKNGN